VAVGVIWRWLWLVHGCRGHIRLGRRTLGVIRFNIASKDLPPLRPARAGESLVFHDGRQRREHPCNLTRSDCGDKSRSGNAARASGPLEEFGRCWPTLGQRNVKMGVFLVRLYYSEINLPRSPCGCFARVSPPRTRSDGAFGRINLPHIAGYRTDL
jgi:hypothetical protein